MIRRTTFKSGYPRQIEIEHPSVPDLYLDVEVTDPGYPPSRDDPGDGPEWRIVGWSRLVGKDASRPSSWKARDVARFDLHGRDEQIVEDEIEGRL